VKASNNEPDYEPLRVWALHPSSVRPPGMAQLLLGGLITWWHATQSLPTAQVSEISVTQATSPRAMPLAQLVAAMIVEVLT
jgi:hypothetical protein